MKSITVRQLASIKRTAQTVNSLVVKKNRINNEIAKLKEDYEALCKEIELFEAGTIHITGYMSEDLVTKVVTETDKLDSKGNPVKVTKYEPTELLQFNEETGKYDIVEKFTESENLEEKYQEKTNQVEEEFNTINEDIL